ncbi:MAG: amidase [Propionibacteriaceae bacterium]|jgi:amidase|nr:amidase [Propionibacteriaceae bacterium]
MDLSGLSAIETARLVRAREVSAREVAESALARAEALGPAVGAFTALAPEYALRQADAIDAALARSDAPAEADAPLLGVPCPVKDLEPVAGVRYTQGSAVFADRVAEEDSDLPKRLRAAGTLMIGKTNTPEFGLPCYTEPDAAVAPPAVTPWDKTRMAGGSSGGAAAAVAAGITPIAHGSDGGGSIRIPASACGLVGLKASRGRVPEWGDVPGPGFATDGMLTRTVRDAALALDVLASRALPPSAVGQTYHCPPPDTSFLAACDTELKGLRVGVLTTPVIAEAEVHPACLDAVAKTAAALEALGHHVEPAPAPFTPEKWSAFAALWAVGALAIDLTAGQEERVRPLTRWLREAGRKYSGIELAQAWFCAQMLGKQVEAAWQGYDLILTPTLAQPPAKLGALRDDADPAADFAAQTRFTPWTSIYNVSGLPAVSLPLHTAVIDAVELPIGVMLGARFGQEATLLAAAAALMAQAAR